MSEENRELLIFNGINGITGTYGLPPMSVDELIRRIQGEQPPTPDRQQVLRAQRRELERQLEEARRCGDTRRIAELEADLKRLRDELEHLGLPPNVDANDLASAGWGAIFPAARPNSPEAERIQKIREALKPLLDLRREQAGERYGLFNPARRRREDGAVRPGESVRDFLRRYGTQYGNSPDPDLVPYYLLIVGSPEAIPFEFQYLLDTQYAVGRLDFGDDLEAYRNYAHSVVAAERGNVGAARRAVFFGATNPGDRPTQLSTEHLIKPLFTTFSADSPLEATLITGAAATKAHLLEVLRGKVTGGPPAFLFTASHGLEFPLDDPQHRQPLQQGALLGSDWRPAERGPVRPEYYLAAQDLLNDASINLLGTIAFLFACYSAGTPLYDAFTQRAFRRYGTVIAERPFVAALPKAMLSLPQGGALAVIGHVERVWATSFFGGGQHYLQTFEAALQSLLHQGEPVGHALTHFNDRYTSLAAELAQEMELIDPMSAGAEALELVRLWTENNDARGYILLGDPAVRLPVGTAGAPTRLEGKAVSLDQMVPATAEEVDVRKPPDAPFSDDDWVRTPPSVKQYIEAAARRRLSSDVPPTHITPHLDAPIVAGQNLVYCATFQLAWNRLCDRLGEPLRLEGWTTGEEAEVSRALNRRLVTEADLQGLDYVAEGGPLTEETIARITETMRHLEHEVTLPQPEGGETRAYLVFAYLHKRFPFDPHFEKFEEPLAFDGAQVLAFGVKENTEAAAQVEVLDYRSDDDFIIKLRSSPALEEKVEWGYEVSHDLIRDEIVLAKVPPRSTLLDTFREVQHRLNLSPQEREKRLPPWERHDASWKLRAALHLEQGDELRIPKIALNLEHRYHAMIGVPWLNADFELYTLREALQRIDFRLDERGAEITAMAEGVAEPTLGVPRPRKLIFDRPFLLYLRRPRALYPYFALWVENADFLEAAPPQERSSSPAA